MYIYKKIIYLFRFYFSFVQTSAQTLLQKNCITQLAYPPPPLSPGFDYLKKNHFKKCKQSQLGMGLVEMLIVITMLALISVGTAYYFTQSQTVMRSSAQDSDCQSIAQSALDRVVSLGTRLYGYKAGYDYNPLLIKKGTQIASTNPAEYQIQDISSGTSLNTPTLYTKLYRELINSNPPSQFINTRVPLVKVNAGSSVQTGTSVLLLNAVNFLQFLYNSDPQFFKGNSNKGKEFTITSSTTTSDGRIASLWKDYLKEYNLQNVKFYIRINPVDLKNQKVIESYADIKCKETKYNGTKFVSTPVTCPRSPATHKLILTHPRLSLSQNPSTAFKNRIKSSNSGLSTIGNPDLGFQVTVKLKYEKESQSYSCNAMQRFAHQTRMLVEGTQTPVSVEVTSLKNGHNKDLLLSSRKQTSCNTDGSNYKNIIMDLKFPQSRSKEFGTVLLCRGIRGCLSGDSTAAYTGASCTFSRGPWQKCHQVKFPGQGGSTSSTFLDSSGNDIKLRLKFNNLPPNRRYELEVIEASQLGVTNPRQIVKSRFYLDAKRPTSSVSIDGNDVGQPGDGVKRRTYSGPTTNWNLPRNGLQCNQNSVSFTGNITDQFTHNLKNCTKLGRRRDGSGTTNINSSISMTIDKTTNPPVCKGTLSGIQHGRQTVTTIPKDVCGGGPNDPLIWDTDLPSTFAAQNFPKSTYWLKNANKTKYTILTEVPANSTAGKFPKHYSVDCDQSQCIGTRKDGNSGKIKCELTTRSLSRDHDGCNPNNVGVKYYHICGGTGGTSAIKETKWSVFVPPPGTDISGQGGSNDYSCQYVKCESDRVCCNLSAGTCGTGIGDKQCGVPNTRHCTNPKGGRQSKNDETLSSCPPLGLNKCTYTLPCEGKSQTPNKWTDRDNDPSRCANKRAGNGSSNSCSFTKPCKCRHDDMNVEKKRSVLDKKGKCYFNNSFDSGKVCDIKLDCYKYYRLAAQDSCPGDPNIPNPNKKCNAPTSSNEWSTTKPAPDQYSRGICDKDKTTPCTLTWVERLPNDDDKCVAKEKSYDVQFNGHCQPYTSSGGSGSCEKNNRRLVADDSKEKCSLRPACISAPGYTPPPNRTSPLYQKHEQTIPRNHNTVKPKTDILFVLDTSGSVTKLMREMVKDNGGIDQFLSSLDMSADFNIATLPAITDHPWSGKIFSTKGGSEPKVLKSTSISSLSQIRGYLKQKFERIKADVNSEHRERGDAHKEEREEMNFKAIIESIRGTRLTENQQLGFFRSDASLIIIFVTDEADVCARFPSYARSLGYTPSSHRDEDPNEQRGANMFCSGITHNTALAALRSLKGAELNIHGIFDSNKHPNHPSSPSKEFSYGIQELVRAVNGVAIPTQSNYTTGFQSIFNHVNAELLRATLQTTLRHRPVANMTRVLLKEPGLPSKSIPFVYDPNTNSVRVDPSNAGTVNAVITVEYYTLRQ